MIYDRHMQALHTYITTIMSVHAEPEIIIYHSFIMQMDNFHRVIIGLFIEGRYRTSHSLLNHPVISSVIM